MDVDHDFASSSPRIGNLRKPDFVGDGAVAGEKVSAHRSILQTAKIQIIENERERPESTLFEPAVSALPQTLTHFNGISRPQQGRRTNADF